MRGWFFFFFFLVGCQTIIDTSPEAVESKDLTLVSAMADGPCDWTPGQGVATCRFRLGSEIQSSWQIILPKGVTGQVTVYFRDFTKQYAITGSIVEIPLKEVIGHNIWMDKDRGAITALAEFKYPDQEGIIRIVHSEGMAVILVTTPPYEPLPPGAPANWNLKCDVQYTTAGRSSLRCR